MRTSCLSLLTAVFLLLRRQRSAIPAAEPAAPKPAAFASAAAPATRSAAAASPLACTAASGRPTATAGRSSGTITSAAEPGSPQLAPAAQLADSAVRSPGGVDAAAVVIAGTRRAEPAAQPAAFRAVAAEPAASARASASLAATPQPVLPDPTKPASAFLAGPQPTSSSYTTAQSATLEQTPAEPACLDIFTTQSTTSRHITVQPNPSPAIIPKATVLAAVHRGVPTSHSPTTCNVASAQPSPSEVLTA